MSVMFSLFRCPAERERLLRGAVVGVVLVFLSVLACPVWAEFRLPDTGQTTCYDNTGEIPCPSPGQPFYGQDANFRGRPQSYLSHGDGTVTDQVTGLMWQQADDGVGRTWGSAVAYCQVLEFAGHADWRLPSRRELLTIMDSGRHYPAMNPVFSCTFGTGYWSGTAAMVGESNAWAMDFGPGISYNIMQISNNLVRCVRGSS